MTQITNLKNDQDLLTAGFNFKQLLSAVLVFFSRFVKIMPNFSLVGSFGFFQSSLLLYMIQIIAFDYFFGGLYQGFIFTYLGFFAYWICGRLARGRFKHQVLLLPIASFLFFLISNFGVWFFWYPRTIAGLMTCYTLALPFYRNTLLGDVFFGGIIISLSKLLKLAKNSSTGQLYAKAR